MEFIKISIGLYIFLFLLSNAQLQLTRTILDDKYQNLLGPLKKFYLKAVGSTGTDPELREVSRHLGKQQTRIPKSTQFFCNTTRGRSAVRPTSVHKLRPGDIDVIAAMGDSITAGNGAMAPTLLQILIENRGVSWSVGGQENWRTFLTLPNILKEFNPDLYGYSITDSFPADRITKFNVAEPGAMSRDIPYQVQLLIKRMQNDPKINMTHDWKMVTILIGANDFCGDMCFYDDPRTVLRNHENDMLKALRALRDNLPRVIVNLVPVPNLIRLLTKLQGKPGLCYYTNLYACPCLFGWRSKYIDYYEEIMKSWQQLDEEIAQRDEFSTETFIVNFQPFSLELMFPKITDNQNDFSYLAPDCFHPSQKAHANFANALWNNMLEPDDQKTRKFSLEDKDFKCPSQKQPYIATRVNSPR